ncbi:MAG: hypothetical protein DWH79_06090 [Planctomycetota bacterium]|nr:MAG: hypothetical protein DWH79_06090 [Planctomycetota bacterium]
MNQQPTEASWIRPLLGRADDMRAEVWVRSAPVAAGVVGAGEALVVSGTLTGPECFTAATLPTTVPLVDQGHVAGQPPLARGVCTEPGFWTPELPNLYRADVVLRRGVDVAAAGWRMVGLRRLGVRGRSLWLDGRRYVPRGVAFCGTSAEVALVRDASAAVIVEAPATAISSAADRQGVPVIIRLCDSLTRGLTSAGLAEQVEAWSAHPSSFLVLLPSDLSAAEVGVVVAAAGRRRGTMLFGWEVDGLKPPPPTVPAGIDCLVVVLPAAVVPQEDWQAPPGLPLLASVRAGDDGLSSNPAAARLQCDAIQALLAAWASPRSPADRWDWAGYLVS